MIFSGEDCDKNKYLYTQISVLKHFVYMGGIYGGKDIRPISQKQDSLHELINTILDKLPLGVFVKDAEDGFRYLYWNRFMEEITGIGTEEVEGHNDFELSFDAIMPAEERLGLDRDVMETGRTIEFSGKISDAYGIPKDIEVTKFPIALSNGKPFSQLSVSDQKKLTEQGYIFVGSFRRYLLRWPCIPMISASVPYS